MFPPSGRHLSILEPREIVSMTVQTVIQVLLMKKMMILKRNTKRSKRASQSKKVSWARRLVFILNFWKNICMSAVSLFWKEKKGGGRGRVGVVWDFLAMSDKWSLYTLPNYKKNWWLDPRLGCYTQMATNVNLTVLVYQMFCHKRLEFQFFSFFLKFNLLFLVFFYSVIFARDGKLLNYHWEKHHHRYLIVELCLLW